MADVPEHPAVEFRPEDVELIRLLPPDVARVVLGCVERRTYQFGDVIVHEGEEGDAYYALLSGRARVLRRNERGDEVALGMLRAGDSFGEIALLSGGKRSATVRASDDVVALRLSAAVFRSLLASQPELRDHVQVQAHFHEFSGLLAAHPALVRLAAPARFRLLSGSDVVPLAAGHLLFQEGDPAGPLYIVDSGRLRAFVRRPDGEKSLAYFRRGDIIGERSTVLGIPRGAGVEALSDSRLLRVSSSVFRELLDSEPTFRDDIAQRVAEMNYEKVARVPADFGEENVPADTKPDAAPPAFDASETEGPRIKRGVIRSFPDVRQIDEMDCGAAALAMICRFYGKRVPLTLIRQLLHTGTDGTRLSALVSGAEHLGLAARSVKASISRLDDLPLPAIIHWQGWHWMVLYRVGKDNVWVADPASGSRVIDREQFAKDWTGFAALFDFTEAFSATEVTAPSMGWLARLVAPHTRTLLMVLGLAGMVSALEMVLPVFSQVIVDRVLVDRDVDLLHVLVGGMIGVLFVMTIADLLQRYFLSFIAVRIDATSLDYLSRRLLALPMSYFAARKTGDIQRRLGGLRSLREFAVGSGLGILTAAGQLTAALAVMLVYSPMLTLVFLGTVPIYVVLMRFSSWRLRPMFAELEETYGAYASRQIDAIKGIETVKALGAEGRLRQALLDDFLRMAGKQFSADFTVMAYQGTIHTVSFLTSTVFLLAGAHKVIDGSMSIGSLFAFNSLVAMANGPVMFLLGTWDGFQHAQVLLDRLADIFDAKPEMPADRAGLTPVTKLKGHVEFRHVSFRFGGPESPLILDDVSFEVAPGQTIACVGRSGSGKTTLIKCLSGLMMPTEGTILFDGIDIKRLDLRDLRRNVGFVLQENFLFNDTIARNIAFADEEPDPDRVVWAATVAAAHEFITRLPLGYETKVGESGVRLSGGQQQRVSIARALYNRPSVLVFDEATSALDTESERAIQENMATLLEGRTAFVIAHRLSTIRDADRILVLEKGRLAESGDHDELMARQGLYFYLCSQQLGI